MAKNVYIAALYPILVISSNISALLYTTGLSTNDTTMGKQVARIGFFQSQMQTAPIITVVWMILRESASAKATGMSLIWKGKNPSLGTSHTSTSECTLLSTTVKTGARRKQHSVCLRVGAFFRRINHWIIGKVASMHNNIYINSLSQTLRKNGEPVE